jgi:hypothetical protein
MPSFIYSLKDPNEGLPHSHQEAAEQILGVIDWQSPTSGWCKCPGHDSHTTGDGKRHTEVRIDGIPTIICQHKSCKESIDIANHELRSLCFRVDKSKNPGIKPTPKPSTPSPAKQAEAMAQALKLRFPELMRGKLVDTLEQIPDGSQEHFRRHLKLFESPDTIWHGDTYDSKPENFRTAYEWWCQLTPIGNFISHSTFKPKSTARTNANIEEVKFLVVESDTLTHSEQRALIATMRDSWGWKLRLILDTAGKSLHAWFEWPAHLEKHHIKAILEAVQCDTKLLTDSQPSRVAGAMRDGKMQAITWLGSGSPVENPLTFEQICKGDNPDAKILEKLASVAFNFALPPPEEPCIYSIGGIEVAHPGNLGTITAQQASGKSSGISAGMASAFIPDGSEADCLGWISRNPHGYAILHFDTEQSRKDHDNLIRRAIRRAGINEPPPWLRSWSVAGWDTKDMIDALEAVMRQAKNDFGGIHSIWLDGVADYVSSPNEEAECVALVRRLHGLASEYYTFIWNVLHLNPGSDFKSRGHLGSQIERKAETVLQLKKNPDEVVTMFTSKSRRAPILESNGPRFRWCDEKKMHVSCLSKTDEKDDADNARITEIVAMIWGVNPSDPLTYSELISEICKVSAGLKMGRGGKGWSAKTAEHKITHMIKNAIISKGETNGLYYKK